MEEQQNQNQEAQPEIVVEQPKKKTIPTRLGSLIILLIATIAGAGVWWFTDSYTPPEAVDVSGIVEQTKESREVKNELPEEYKIKADGVYYKDELIEEADIATFEYIEYRYAKDKNNIYYLGERVKNIDRLTFEYLGKGYAKDKNYVYYSFMKGLDSEVGIIKEADMETFEYLDYFYAKDKDHVYEFGEVSEEEDWKTGEVSEEKDPATFEILDRYITKDKNYVYYYVPTSAKGIFRDADSETFEVLEDRYYKDKDNVYYDYHDYNKIEGADPVTFEVLSEGYSKDKNYVYKNRKIVEGADTINCTAENLEGCESLMGARNILRGFVKNGTFYIPQCSSNGAIIAGETYIDDIGLTCSVDLFPIIFKNSQMILSEAKQKPTMIMWSESIMSYGSQLKLFSDIDGDGDEDAVVLIRQFEGRLNLPFLAVVEYQDDEAVNTDTIVIEGDTATIDIQESETGVFNIESCGWYSRMCWRYSIEYSEGKLHITSREEILPEPGELACLASGTKILMADGNYKNIENIKVEDLVISYNIETKEHTTSKVDKVIKRKDPLVIINNTLRVAPDEPVYLADGTIKEAIDIEIGDYLVNEKGEQVKVNTIENNPELVDTYDFTLENGNNFFADGYLVRTPDL